MTLRNIESLFSGQCTCILGSADSPAQEQMLSNIRASASADAWHHIPETADQGQLPDADIACAVIMDDSWGTPEIITALEKRGCRGIIWAARSMIRNTVLRAARPARLRLLGSRTVGLYDTRNGLNATTLASQPRPGHVALISQSQSIAAAAVDWALGRNIGFSRIACTGSEADIDAADMLDHAALDPRTRAIVLQVSRISNPRKFMSAARAAAHVKPVLVLQTRARRHGGKAGPDAVLSAAFARAGMVECASLGALFDGLAALELLPRVRQERVMVVANGGGVCALAADALQRNALSQARLDEQTVAQLSDQAPSAQYTDVGIDVVSSDTKAIVTALRLSLADTGVDAALLVHSPVAGHPHAPMVEAVAEAGLGDKLMTVWLGLETALPARAASANARLATFISPDEAARALRYRRRYHETHELLTATPPPDPTVTADVEFTRHRLQVLAAGGVEWLSSQDTHDILADYGIVESIEEAAEPIPLTHMRIRVLEHEELGLFFQVSDESLDIKPAHGFAPLDPLLAHRLLSEASAERLSSSTDVVEVLVRALVRLSKLIMDQATISRLDLYLAISRQGNLYAPTDALMELTPRPLVERRRLALPAYPARMRHRVPMKDGEYLVRAIHPADEPLVLNLLSNLKPEEIQLRFFSTIRHFTHDMAARMTQVDYDREVSLVISPAGQQDKLIGMGTIIADPDGRAAEFAVLVHHDYAGIGLGRHLLDCLLRQAHARAIGTVYGDILAHNRPMLELARSLGFTMKRCLEDTTNIRAEIDMNTWGRENMPQTVSTPS